MWVEWLESEKKARKFQPQETTSYPFILSTLPSHRNRVNVVMCVFSSIKRTGDSNLKLPEYKNPKNKSSPFRYLQITSMLSMKQNFTSLLESLVGSIESKILESHRSDKALRPWAISSWYLFFLPSLLPTLLRKYK